MSGREGAAMGRGGAGRDQERVSRRDLLRRVVGHVAVAMGAEAAPPRAQTGVLQVPYVPYGSRPTGPRESQVEEEHR